MAQVQDQERNLKVVRNSIILLSLLTVGCTVIVMDSEYNDRGKMSIGGSTSLLKASEGNSSSE
jgi:hypothetical protein